MKGDFSKDTFDAKKHFHDVLMQQGRVMLDTDWNEQAAISAYRTEAGIKDIVGDSGAPMHNAGFALTPVAPSDLMISKGHYYVDGILCENENDLLYSNQPDYDATALPTKAGTYFFYLDVWQRHMTVLEDPAIREVALGGPDTTTRVKTVWQVKSVETKVPVNCLTNLPADIITPPSGTMMARAEKSSGSSDPCGLITSGGYKRLENQLYRVEIHTAGSKRADATFKWQRDNASVIVKWEAQDSVDPNKLVVSSTGRDDLLGFKAGNWVELINDSTDLMGKPGILAELSQVEENVLTLKSSSIKFPTGVTKVADLFKKNPKVRRWDSAGDIKLNANNTTWLSLEEGVEVKFDEGTFKTGDYWMIPARTIIANIEWPFSTPQPPRGIGHHFSRLGILKLDGAGWSVISDCRPIFPPVTELIELSYLSGDGQEAKPSTALGAPLKVGVANGKWPVSGATVKFEILSGGGTLSPASGTIVSTIADGTASCTWTLGDKDSAANQQVKATLLDAAGNAMHLPVLFNAKLVPPEMFYVSGDGQEAMPGAALPVPLKVGVSYEQIPVTGARVKFELLSGGGTLTTVPAGGIVTTDANGIAFCNWKLGTTGIQQVKATMLDKANNPVHLPVIFTSDLSVAENVAYKSQCNNWTTATPPATVAQALDALCERTSDGDCCSVTVGPKQKDGSVGEYETILDALIELSKKGAKDISLCLIPGEHMIDKDIDMPKLKISLRTLEITGYAAIITMRAEYVDLVAEKIVLEGFTMKTVKNATIKTDNSQIVLTGNAIFMGHCALTRPGTSMQPFVAVSKESVVNLKNNSILSTFSLVLANGVQGVIEDNLISYILLQNKSLSKFSPIPLLWDDATAAKIKSDVRQNEKGLIAKTDWAMNIRGNRLGVLQTDISRTQPQDLYKNMLVIENVFQLNNNGVASEYMNMSNNTFLQEIGDDAVVAFAFTYNGIIMGNMGIMSNEKPLGHISAIVIKVIKGQALNHVEVDVT